MAAMEELVPSFTIGHHDPKAPYPVTMDYINDAHAAGYDLVTSPITTSQFHSKVLTQLSNFLSVSSQPSKDDITSTYNASPVQVAPLTPEDTPLTPDTSTGQTVGVVSSWIDLTSPDPVIADISAQVLHLEIAYAAFCGITYILVPAPKLKKSGAGETDVLRYARAIQEALDLGPYLQLFIWSPMVDHRGGDPEPVGDLTSFARAQFVDDFDSETTKLDLFGTWEAWDVVRSMCKYSTRLFVALDVPAQLPPIAVQDRWYSEPVRLLTLHARSFVKNAKGYPVLTKPHQALITRFVQHKQPSTWFLLCDVGAISNSFGIQNSAQPDSTDFPTIAESSKTSKLKDSTPHLSYMRNLQTKQPAQSAADRFGAGYQDYLQAPLQPLTVHLESITYEVFEKDPVKYEWYEVAVARALSDWIEQEKPTSNPDGRVVVAVVGAGRGPLVTRAIQASEAVGVDIDIWALEKNPNAFVLLQRTNNRVWDDQVKLVKSDMRTWRGPVRQATQAPVRKVYNCYPEDEDETNPGTTSTSVAVDSKQTTDSTSGASQVTHYKIDILISELLGSFADNELSPECLDGVQHLMNPVHGISIPASYTAHFTPIAAPKLHTDISLNMSNLISHAAEIPYVVMLNAIDFLSRSAGPVAALARTTEKTSSMTATQQSAGTEDALVSRFCEEAVIQQAWAFHHPNPELPAIANLSATATSAPSNGHNTRYCSLSFPVPNRGTCHGLGGYFESVLYSGVQSSSRVELSTNPLTMRSKSADMISWFPIFFPLKRPLYIPDNSIVTVQMWRQTDDRKVWYEWIVDVYTTLVETYTDQKTGEHRRREKRVKIGGSEAHSSLKEACLM